jgi:hypothetical protein
VQVCGSHGSDRASPEREAIATSQGGWLAERPLCGIADRYTWLDQEDTRCNCWRRTKLIRRHDPDAELAFRLTFYLCEGRSTGPTSDAVTASGASASFSGTVSIQPYTSGAAASRPGGDSPVSQRRASGAGQIY